MNRKVFLQASSLLSMASVLPSIGNFDVTEEALPLVPPYLKKGDRIGICSPAGYITQEELVPAIRMIESWGLQASIGSSIGKKDFTFGGTDEERAADLQQLLDDANIDAILCARGGYGLVRLIDRLNWEKFRLRPKWIVGFSDATVLHSHLSRQLSIASIHSKMCNSFPDDWEKAEPVQKESILSIRRALMGESIYYDIPSNARNKAGSGSGVLLGGNLKTLETLSASASDIKTLGRILFVEDTGEYLYSIDRMFWNLKRSGKLESLAGLIIGGFKVKIDEGDEPFGRDLQDIVLEKVKKYSYPVCFDFPVGHQKNNFALKCGIRHRLDVLANACSLKEIRS